MLADGATASARNDARGHLFESFVARLLHEYGFGAPTTEGLNVTFRGIEIDVVATHELTGQRCLAECKAYASPVPAKMVSTFYGKLAASRLSTPKMFGFFVALPTLTSDGIEQAEQISSGDNEFRLLTAIDIVGFLENRRELVDPPSGHGLLSDQAVVITEHGIYTAAKLLDESSRLPVGVQVWGLGVVPTPVRDLLVTSDFAGDLPIEPLQGERAVRIDPRAIRQASDKEQAIIEVASSSDDFEYQLPASPRFFVGRRELLQRLEEVTAANGGKARALVLNAQSGWGKSSLALRLRQAVVKTGGRGVVLDTRTASSQEYVWASLRRIAVAAEQDGLLTLPEDAAFGSLASSLATLQRSTWKAHRDARLLLFFDQFESVFRDERLTQEFRDLVFSLPDLALPLIVGFAWKTDIVGWTEEYPYQLRDDIRSQASVFVVEPLGASDIGTLLGRLQRAVGQPLAPELRRRVREYSQGLPWLFKKLASHILRELEAEVTQEELVAEGLNVQRLFESDLAELTPAEHEGLRVVASSAPSLVSELLELIPSSVVQSLLDRRLIVQIGGRIDTYWDIFRDFLNTGRVPIQETYILRYTPPSVARLLRVVVEHGGDIAVSDAAQQLSTSETFVFNLARELRLMGVLVSVPKRVRLAQEIRTASDTEAAVRERIAGALRRHRAYSILTGMLDSSAGQVTTAQYAEALPQAFPAISVRAATWTAYARAFVRWFEYAGLVGVVRDVIRADPLQEEGFGLLATAARRRMPEVFPNGYPSGATDFLRLLTGSRLEKPLTRSRGSRALRDLRALGIVEVTEEGFLGVAASYFEEGGEKLGAEFLRSRLTQVTGGAEAVGTIEANPSVSNTQLGAVLRTAVGASWKESTTAHMGKMFRAWAKAAGVQPQVAAGQSNLFEPDPGAGEESET